MTYSNILRCYFSVENCTTFNVDKFVYMAWQCMFYVHFSTYLRNMPHLHLEYGDWMNGKVIVGVLRFVCSPQTIVNRGYSCYRIRKEGLIPLISMTYFMEYITSNFDGA